MKEALGTAPPGLQLRAVQGHAVTVLVGAADGADPLIVGCRGHGGFVGLLLGSVSEHVVAQAPCPVVVVRQSVD